MFRLLSYTVLLKLLVVKFSINHSPSHGYQQGELRAPLYTNTPIVKGRTKTDKAIIRLARGVDMKWEVLLHQSTLKSTSNGVPSKYKKINVPVI